MAINFPSSPSVGTGYTYAGVEYLWDGEKWDSVSRTGFETLSVSGDARITGILTVGTSSLTLDGDTDVVNVGSALTLGNSVGLQYHTQSLNAQGFAVNNINASGIITASSFSGVDYDDLSNKPTIPTNNNQLTNGAGFITTSFTNTNQLTNGAGFITTSFTNTNELTNGAEFITNTVTGDFTVTGSVSVGGTLTYEDVTNIDSVGIITARSGVSVPDDSKYIAGTGDDLQLYHASGNSYIDNATGILYIRGANGNHIKLQSPSGEDSVVAEANGSVELYYDNVKKLQTTNNGVTVTGTLISDSKVGIGSLVPVGKLDVVGNVRIFEPSSTETRTLRITNSSQSLFLGVEGTSGGGNIIGSSAGDGTLSVNGNFRISTNNGASANFSLLNDGKIGINNNAPLHAMHFKNAMSSSPSFIHMEVTGSNTVGGGGGISFDTSATSVASNNGLYLATISGVRNSDDDGSNDLIFKTSKSGVAGDDGNTHSPKERLRITSDGHMGLGAFNNTSYDSIAQNFLIADESSHAGMTIRSGGSGAFGAIHFADGVTDNSEKRAGRILYSHGDDFMSFCTVNVERFRVDSSGKFGIGTQSASSYYANDLVVSGSAEGGITINGPTTGQSYLAFADGTSGNERYRGYIAYDHNTDTLKFASGVSERIRIDSSGKFGIGTQSPAELLHVSGSGTQAIRLENTAASGNANLELKLTSNTLTIGVNPSTNYFQDTAGRDYIWYQGSNERMRIAGDGKVQIASTNTTGLLNVGGRIYAKEGSSGMLFQEVSNGAYIFLDGADGDFSGGDYFHMAANNNSQLEFGYAGAGKIFIENNGVTKINSPSNQKLILEGCTSPYLQLRDGTSDKAYFQYDGASGNIYIWNQNSGKGLRLASNPKWYDGTAYRTLWHSGNDGAGSGLDADTLDGVESTSYMGKTASTYWNANTWISLNGSHGLYWPSNYSYHLYLDNQYLQIRNNSTSNGIKVVTNTSTTRGYFYADQSNAIGILNNAGSWGFKMDSSGNCTATGDVTAYSDIRLKENIRTVDNALNMVKSMRGVYFDRKDTGKSSVGVIAQEMEEILPQVVKTSDARSEENTDALPDIKTVSYGNIVGVLIEAIKEQQVQIDELKAKLEVK